MKKLFSIFAASMMLFAASCSSEKIDEPTGDGNVTFAVQLPTGLESRTVGDGTTATQLYVSVYEKDGSTPLSVSPAAQAISLTKTVTLQLVTGKTYDIVFWAQAADAPYSYQADGRKVQMNYDNAPANAENRDAFFYILNDFTVTGPMSQAVTLKRPFAQLNFATSDMAAAQQSGLDVNTTSVVVKQLLPTLNLDNGLAEGTPADVTFTDAAIPNVQKTVGTQTYEYLSFNYLLMDETRSTVDVKLTAKESDDDLRELEVASVPVQRNYRTNIYGALLTSSVNYTVTIDPNFGGENNGEGPSFFNIGANGQYFSTIAEAIASLPTEGTAEQNVVTVAAGTYDIPTSIDRNVTFEGVGSSRAITVSGAKMKFTGAVGAAGKSVIFKNVTVECPTSNYHSGFQHSVSAKFENCKFTGIYFGYSQNLSFTNCEFTAGNDQYSIWTYGAKNITIDNCTFNTQGKAILVYNEGAATNYITINNTTFDASVDAGKAAVEIHSELGSNGTLTINNSTATGFNTAGLWQELNNSTKKATHNFVTTVDGQAYYLNGVTIESENEYGINSAIGLLNFAKDVNVSRKGFSGKTVKLLNDIDLNNAAWTSVGQTGSTQFSGTFDGNNKTISKLNVNNNSADGNCATGLFGWLNGATVKNVKIEGAVVKGHHNVGVIAGYLEATGCNITGCTVNNAEIECTSVNSDANGDKCGGIVGYARNAGVRVASCVVTNSTISAGRDAGQVVGAALEANVTDCSATNVTVTANGTSTGANIRNEVIGRILQ